MRNTTIIASIFTLFATCATAQTVDFSVIQSSGTASFSETFPSCTTTTSSGSTVITNPTPGSNCNIQPSVQTIKVYSLALCPTKPTAPTTSAAAGLTNANCSTIYSNSTGASVNIVLDTVTTLTGGTFTKPPNGTYYYFYLELDPTVSNQASVKFSSTMADSNGVTSGVYCWSINATTYTYSLNTQGSMPQATTCSSSPPSSSAVGSNANVYNSLMDLSSAGGPGFNNAFINLPTTVGPQTLDAFLVGSTGVLAASENVNSISNVKKLIGIMKLPTAGVSVTSSTQAVIFGYNNKKGAQVSTQSGASPSRLTKFGAGPFDVSITIQ